MRDFETVDILLVEDGDADAEIIARALRKGGIAYRLVRVRDGVEALEFLSRQGAFNDGGALPKLVLMDLKMPRLGGIDVLKRLKAAEHTKVIPVVMLTSSAEERDIAECYGLGANSYLVKPANSTAFSEIVGRAGSYWLHLNRAARLAAP